MTSFRSSCTAGRPDRRSPAGTLGKSQDPAESKPSEPLRPLAGHDHQLRDVLARNRPALDLADHGRRRRSHPQPLDEGIQGAGAPKASISTPVSSFQTRPPHPPRGPDDKSRAGTPPPEPSPEPQSAVEAPHLRRAHEALSAKGNWRPNIASPPRSRPPFTSRWLDARYLRGGWRRRGVGAGATQEGRDPTTIRRKLLADRMSRAWIDMPCSLVGKTLGLLLLLQAIECFQNVPISGQAQENVVCLTTVWISND